MDAEFWGTLLGAAIGSAFAVHKGISIFVDKVVAYTAAQSTLKDVQSKVNQIEIDLAAVKKATVPAEKPEDRRPG